MPPPLTPVEKFVIFARLLTDAVVARGLYFQFIPQARVSWVIGRLNTLRDRFARLARRVAAGTYKPRETVTRPAPPPPKTPPRQVVPPKRGWLGEALPQAAQYRGMLRDLLNDPQTQDLIRAAPAEAARILRPLYWMLGGPPPPILALPPRPRPAAPRTPRPRKPPAPAIPAPVAPAPPSPPADRPDYSHHFLGPCYRRNA